MDYQNLIEQLHAWHDDDCHDLIVKTIEEIPENQWTFELKSLLGRAYNNNSDYEKALEILLPEKANGMEDALWNFRVGYSYYYSNKEADAIPYFEKSAALGDKMAEDFLQWSIQHLERRNLYSKWFEFTVQHVEKLVENNGDWETLAEDERELAALWRLEIEMYNGGFIQFFCNWGYTCYLYAVQALKHLEAEEALDIVQKQYGFIQHLEHNTDIKELWDIPKFLSEDEQSEIGALDEQYWENKDNIVERTFRVYDDSNAGSQQSDSLYEVALKNIVWAFSSKFYADAESFNKDVSEYQNAILKTLKDWKPNEALFQYPEVQIQYEAWIFKPTDLLDNEKLVDEDRNVFEEQPDDDGYQVEITARFRADNGENFTVLEFLMKTHNQLCNKELGDHVFFEGLDGPEMSEGLPTWYIACGS